jgi:GNAT superfamily N-acetyltransferase
MAAELREIGLVNIYAPCIAEKKQERESFFNIDLPYLLRAIPTTVIVGGDFICVVARTDGTDHFNYSRALDDLVKGVDLVDVWATAPERGIYIRYTKQGAARLGRIYVTRNIRGRKIGAETVVTAFAYHLAVNLRIALDLLTIRRGRGYWLMNVQILQNTHFQDKLRQQWTRWAQQRKTTRVW